ncbi:hypothetical protein ACLI1L_001905 [Corynebacterium sp. LaCa117]|uniref:hypothetical protein n=1 Tax=Corynebacterium sp. LaCa117 TaxID=3391424 RepID=UPI003988AEFD
MLKSPFGALVSKSAPRNPATVSALHKEITASQRRGYGDFAKNFGPDVDTYTWNEVRAIELEAHTSVGFSQSEAEALTDYGIEKLKQQGLYQPTNIPWNPGVL